MPKDMTMIERVARAICIDLGELPDSTDGGLIMIGRDGIRPNWEGYECTARAALEAMREPTEEMDEAGHAAWSEWEGDGDEHLGETAVAVIWRAGIAATLKDKP